MKTKQTNNNSKMFLVLLALFLLVIGGNLLTFRKAHAIKKIPIVLDAAYGGENKGNIGLLNESDFNEQVVTALETLLTEDGRFEVIRSHPQNTDADISQRTEIITQAEPELVISIHAAWDHNKETSGMHIYVQPPAHKNHDESVKIAEAVKTAFTKDDWTPDVSCLYYEPYEDGTYKVITKGVDETMEEALETWGLLEKCEYPTIVVEQLYLSNQQDVDRWTKEDGYQQIAQLYFESLKSLYDLE